MRLRSLLGLLVIAGLIFGFYTWAKPKVPKKVPQVPRTVVVNVPNPLGG